MRKGSQNPTMRRILLVCAQHIIMAAAAFIVVMVFQESIIRVESVQAGNRQYRIDPFDSAEYFEETDVFHDMFNHAANDLVMLIALRNEFETDGVYDGQKRIDVVDYETKRGKESESPVSAAYSLENMVKWGKAGIEMQTCSLTKSEFVNFFNDTLLDISHYYLEPDTDVLRYSGEMIGDRSAHLRSLIPVGTDIGQNDEAYWNTYVENQIQHLQEVFSNYQQYNEEQLIDMAFSYYAPNMDKTIEIVEEDDVEYVEMPLLDARYMTVDGKTPLQIATNWLDYCKLEEEIIAVLEDVTANYNLYEACMEQYAGNNSNVQYFSRLPDGNGYQIYTNLADSFVVLETDEIDYYFQENGKYLIYDMDAIACETNMDISDESMYQMLKPYEYEYPAGTRIWIGVSDGYAVQNDPFAQGSEIFDRVALHARDYAMIVLMCTLAWIALCAYLTYTAGDEENEAGELVVRVNGFDRIYTEFVLVTAGALIYAGRRGLSLLLSVVANGDYGEGQQLAFLPTPFKWTAYGMGALYGFLVSFAFCVIWYSLVRRLKYGNLWQDSILHWCFAKVYEGISLVLYHKSVAVRTMIPYNLFLLFNIGMIAATYLVRQKDIVPVLLIVVLLLFDAGIWMLIFRRNAEIGDIFDAIKQLRKGEIEKQLEPERMHGENQEIAEAVNNISDGIRSAVATSVKDERLKSDLITNVSHDIKTPLTSIINYVDLLKREKIAQEPARSYIDILETKAQRLKQLTDDLVEASKISSGNIVLQYERIDLNELLNQSIGELSDKFEEEQLSIIFTPAGAPACIRADSRRMWRIIENLFHNVCKYAMPGTRVYIDIRVGGGNVEASFKNISRQQLNISADDLTERFIRGDESRTTEGSGLGLSIAKNLTEIQNGSFQIDLDGDLFKVLLKFPEFAQEESAAGETDSAGDAEDAD